MSELPPQKIAHLYAGLTKSARLEANELVQFALKMIEVDNSNIPEYQRAWRSGFRHGWHQTRNTEHRIHQLIKTLETLMARPKSKKRASSGDFDKYQFVRCEMRAEDKKSAKIWIEENTAELGALLHDAIASGNKFSCTFSSEHDTFTACFTGKPDESINEYKTLTARHKDWVVATLTLLYKTLVIFKGGVWESEDDTEDDGWA